MSGSTSSEHVNLISAKGLTERARAVYVNCTNCSKKIWPFKLNPKDGFRMIRCEKCHRELSKVWFDDYAAYIATFKGQV